MDYQKKEEQKEGRLTSNTKPMIIEKILSKSKQLMGKGNVNGALGLLINNMSNGTLPLSNDTLLVLHVKYPEQQMRHYCKIQSTASFMMIQKKALAMKVAIKSKGGCGPSGHDADNWRRILVSKSVSSCSLDLQKSLANFVKNLCIKSIHATDNVIESRLEAFMES